MNHAGSVLARHATRTLQFLANHAGLHRCLMAVMSSRACEWAVTTVCRILAGQADMGTGERAFQRIRDLRNFAEGTHVNVVNEIHEYGDLQKLRWMLHRLGQLEPRRKARLLSHLFFNLVLSSLNRKVTDLRQAGQPDAVPNLSTLLFAPFARCNLNCIGCVNASDKGARMPPSIRWMTWSRRRNSSTCSMWSSSGRENHSTMMSARQTCSG